MRKKQERQAAKNATKSRDREIQSPNPALPLCVLRVLGGESFIVPIIKLTTSRNVSHTGQREMETSPACGSVLGPDLAAVRFDEGLGDGES